MNAFDKIIGYEAIKQELEAVCDIIREPEVYEKLGVRIPRGIMLTGKPGMGKTSNTSLARREAVIQPELERYLRMARDILIRNRAFLEKAADILAERKSYCIRT